MVVIAKKLATIKEKTINNPPENRTEKSVSSPVTETIAWNAVDSIHFISQPNSETINERSDKPANNDFDLCCCDNISGDGDNQSGGGCDCGGDGSGVDGGGDGGGCDGGGD